MVVPCGAALWVYLYNSIPLNKKKSFLYLPKKFQTNKDGNKFVKNSTIFFKRRIVQNFKVQKNSLLVQ